MKSIITALLALSIGLIPCAQAQEAAAKATKHEEIANKLVDTMVKVITLSVSATDLESAKASAVKIGELKKTVDGLAEELKPLEVPSEEDKQALTKKIEARMAKFQEDMGEKMAKISETLDAKSQMALNMAMADFFKHMDTHEETFKKHFEANSEEE